MLGVQRVLRFGSLREAILAAQLAEADMAIAKSYSSRHYHSSSSSSSSAPSYGGGGGGRGYRYQRYGSRPAADSGSTLNYTRAEGSTLGESDRPSSPQQAQLYGFRYSRDSSNGRYVLSEAEAPSAVRREAMLQVLQAAPVRTSARQVHHRPEAGSSSLVKIVRPPPSSPVRGQDVVIPARPDEGQERQEGEPPKPGEQGVDRDGQEAGEQDGEAGGVGEQKEAEWSEDGGFDINRCELEQEEEDGRWPRFLGDRALLYSHDVAQDKTAARRMMVFRGTVAGHQAVVLLDLGANANFVSTEWVQRMGMPVRQMSSATEVTTATGKTHAAQSRLPPVDVHVAGTRYRTPLVVMPLSTYDVILGTPWFEATKPHFDWEQWTCNGRAVCTKAGRSIGHPGRTPS